VAEAAVVGVPHELKGNAIFAIVQVREDVTQATSDGDGVYLATASEAKHAVKELSGCTGSTAVLSPIAVEGADSEEVSVLVTDKDGRTRFGGGI
jgi:acyl-coenzyme A synthetase/AMP-(fatty) acid ligase